MDRIIGVCSSCGSEEFAIEYSLTLGESYVYCRNCFCPAIRINKDDKAFVNYKKETRHILSELD